MLPKNVNYYHLLWPNVICRFFSSLSVYPLTEYMTKKMKILKCYPHFGPQEDSSTKLRLGSRNMVWQGRPLFFFFRVFIIFYHRQCRAHLHFLGSSSFSGVSSFSAHFHFWDRFHFWSCFDFWGCLFFRVFFLFRVIFILGVVLIIGALFIFGIVFSFGVVFTFGVIFVLELAYFSGIVFIVLIWCPPETLLAVTFDWCVWEQLFAFVETCVEPNLDTKLLWPNHKNDYCPISMQIPLLYLQKSGAPYFWNDKADNFKFRKKVSKFLKV